MDVRVIQRATMALSDLAESLLSGGGRGGNRGLRGGNIRLALPSLWNLSVEEVLSKEEASAGYLTTMSGWLQVIPRA